MGPPLSLEAGADTRTRLLRAAAHLFARKGIDAVRNHEIHKLAGQRNESAIHYHFGSKWAVVAAILDENEQEVVPHLPALEELNGAEDVVDFLVRRLAYGLETPHGRDWLRIVSELMARFRYGADGFGTGPSTQLAVVSARLDELLPSLPSAVARRRTTAMVGFMTAQMADRARATEDGQLGGVSDQEFLDELRAMSLGMLTAPHR